METNSHFTARFVRVGSQPDLSPPTPARRRQGRFRQGPLMDHIRRVRNSLAIGLAACLMASVVHGQMTHYEVVTGFGPSGSPISLVEALDGTLFGMANNAGAPVLQYFFQVDTSGRLRVVGRPRCETPEVAGGLIQAADGDFYGTTYDSGTRDLGTVFRVDSRGVLLTLHSFLGADGQAPAGSLVQGGDGYFYGTTSGGGAAGKGTVFRIDWSGALTTLHTFTGADGANPSGNLVWTSDGSLYGTTLLEGPEGGGTVFRWQPSDSLTTLHAFKTSFLEHARPKILRQAPDGTIFGGTASYTIHNPPPCRYFCTIHKTGTLFKIAPDGSFTQLQVLSTSESEPQSLVIAADGELYGSTRTSLFHVDQQGAYATLHTFDTAGTTTLLQAQDGYLYGTTPDGGANGHGATFFRSDMAGNVTVLHRFSDGSVAPWNGAFGPIAQFQAADGDVYGTTVVGGAYGSGTVFRVDSTGSQSNVHEFQGPDGSAPVCLTQQTDGTVFGVTALGGQWGNGTVFAISQTGSLRQIYEFQGTDGSRPSAIVSVASDLYGTTLLGGAAGFGTIFHIDAAGKLTTLYTFNGATDHGYPQSLVLGSDGLLYGTASGWLFRANPAGGFEAIPQGAAGISRGSDGAFYIVNVNAVWKMDTHLNFTLLHQFSGSEGSFALGAPLLASDGGVYGTTFYGTADGSVGTIFRIAPNGAFSTIHEFFFWDGASPSTPLLQASDGSIYGTAEGGRIGNGVLFRLGTKTLSIGSVDPSSGPAAGGTSALVLGGGFGADDSVTVGGIAIGATVQDPTGICLITPQLEAGTLNSVTVWGALGPAVLPNAFLADFLDVDRGDHFHPFVERVVRRGIAGGCGGGNYCRDAATMRKQMAVFVLKAKEGASYAPPPATGVFSDVPSSDPFAPWIEELHRRGVVAGCGDGTAFCPNDPVLRQQMAVFLLKTLLGSSYTPPACAGLFPDVPCSSPFAPWIEDLFNRSIAAGCGNDDYCPSHAATRGQMAVFLVKTFGLQ